MDLDNGSDSGPTIRDWLTTLPTTLILLVIIFLGIGESLHSRLLSLGEQTWPGYFTIRKSIEKPDCNPDFDLEKRVEKEVQRQQQDDGLGLVESTVDRDSIRESLKRQREECNDRWTLYKKQKKSLTPAARVFRSVEQGVAILKEFSLNYTRHILVFLILITAIVSTVTRHHVVLRPQKTVMDHWVSTSAQFLANVSLLVTVISYWYTSFARSGPVSNPIIHVLWIGGFGILTLVSLYQLLRGVPDDSWPEGGLVGAMMSVPLYVYICLIGSVWFFLVEGYFSGMTVQLRKMERFSSLFLKVGLYVWTGMLLKWSRLTKLVLDLIRPWKFPPELVVVVFVMLCAFPTAYSGASGIFVIAAGAVIYKELRNLGTRRQLSIATTAMSGSGVFLEPCLIVVIIAALNNEVTTESLFHYGFMVYLLMGLVTAMIILINRQNELSFAPPSKALKPCLKALVPLVPYMLAGAGVIAGFYYTLDVPFDEYTAPDILPFMMLLIIFYDQWFYGPIESEDEITTSARKKETETVEWTSPIAYLNEVRRTVRRATSETTQHIGSLLMLMATTMILSGIVERSQVMSLVPSQFATVWTAMVFLVVVLVIIGMTMDPYGAVILVSATFAPVAYKNGIEPVHFWLVVLVAFELGYLTPPVALNQQFTRMVIGEKEYEAVATSEKQYDSFWRNYEYIVLPICVMAIVLLVVAFGPLFVGLF